MTELPIDFRMYVALIYRDVLELAEKQHSVGAFTSCSMVLAKCYQIAKNKDPLLPENHISTQDVLNWAREAKESVDYLNTFTPINKFSQKLGKVMVSLAMSIENSVEKGASFPFIIGLLTSLSRGYYLHTGNILTPSFEIDSPSQDLKKLLTWGFEFKFTLRVPLEADSLVKIYNKIIKGEPTQ